MSYCSDLTRERIMECAKVEFLKKGFQATQLKDIVTAAKVTTGAIYRHFKDKEALFFALIEDVYHYTLDFLDNADPYDKVGISTLAEMQQRFSRRKLYRRNYNSIYETECPICKGGI